MKAHKKRNVDVRFKNSKRLYFCHIYNIKPNIELGTKLIDFIHAVTLKHKERTTILVGEEEQSGKQEVKDKFTEFVKWMSHHGAKFPDQHLVKYNEDNRGVHAKKDIPKERQIAYIPLKLLAFKMLSTKMSFSGL